MPAGVVPTDVVAVTLHDTNKVTQPLIAIQASTGGIIKVVNRVGDTIDVTLSSNQILPFSCKGLVLKSTGSTASGIVGYK